MNGKLDCAASFSTWNWSGSSNSSSSQSDVPVGIPVPTPTSVDGKIQKQVLDSCAALHSSIMPFNAKIRGPLARNSDKGTSLPFVFLVGNHSSGQLF